MCEDAEYHPFVDASEDSPLARLRWAMTYVHAILSAVRKRPSAVWCLDNVTWEQLYPHLHSALDCVTSLIATGIASDLPTHGFGKGPDLWLNLVVKALGLHIYCANAILCGEEPAHSDADKLQDELSEYISDLSAFLTIAEAHEKAGAKAPSNAPAKGMPWEKARTIAESHCARNPFPGVKALAKIVGCSPSTMSKVIDRSSLLRAKLATHEASRRSASGKTKQRELASTRQLREADPIDRAAASTDDLFRRLLEQAKPEERAKLNAMTAAERRELITQIEHDPDAVRHRGGSH